MYKKLSISFFVLFTLLVTQLGWAQTLRNDNAKDEAQISDEKVNLQYQTIYFDNK